MKQVGFEEFVVFGSVVVRISRRIVAAVPALAAGDGAESLEWMGADEGEATFVAGHGLSLARERMTTAILN